MNDRRLTLIVFLLLLAAASAPAWESYILDLPSGIRESAWRDALSQRLGGKAEVPVKNGRIDVLTTNEAIEIDWPHKWHEGLGQALHYAAATGRTGVLALISYSLGPDNLRRRSRERFDMVEKICRKSGIKLIILFPSRQRRPARSQVSPAGPAATGTPTQPADQPAHWLNTRTGVRHRPGCRFYRNTDEGRPCGPDEGRPCRICGG